jgi:hypothetical protein
MVRVIPYLGEEGASRLRKVENKKKAVILVNSGQV